MTQQQFITPGASPYGPPPPTYAPHPWPLLREYANTNEAANEYLMSLMGTSADNPCRLAAPIIEDLLQKLKHNTGDQNGTPQ